MRALAGKMQNERAAAAESKDAARHDENALGQQEEPTAVKAGSRLEVLVLVTCAEDDGRDLQGLRPVAGGRGRRDC